MRARRICGIPRRCRRAGAGRLEPTRRPPDHGRPRHTRRPARLYTRGVNIAPPTPEAPATEPTIRLDDVLKLAGVATTGGQAKQLIQTGQVKVNGAIETRRKHALRAGDEVEVDGVAFVVDLEDVPEDDFDDLDQLEA